MAKRKEQNRSKDRKPLRRILWLALLLWILSLFSFGAVVVNLQREIGALQAANVTMAARIAAMQEKLGHAASQSDLDALAADLARLRQEYELAAEQSAPAAGELALASQAGGMVAAEHAHLTASDDSIAEPSEPLPWYAVLKERASLYGSQLFRAVTEALRPRPLFP